MVRAEMQRANSVADRP